MARETGLPEGLCGFLLGLFGMTVVNRLFITLEGLDLGAHVSAWIGKFSGKQQ
jgi:hypothetical protein